MKRGDTMKTSVFTPTSSKCDDRRFYAAGRGVIKRVISATAFCIAAGALISPPLAASETVSGNVEFASPAETLETAFEKLIASSKQQMMRDPAAALDYATSAQKLVENAMDYPDRRTALATAMWLRGEAFKRSGKPKDGASIIAEALSLLKEDERTSKLGGDLLLAQGRVASRLSDTNTAVQSFFGAHEIFVDLGETRSEAVALQAIGSIYRDAEAYDRAIDYYKRAAEVHPGDARLNLSSFNNQGNTLKELGRYDEARPLFKKALTIAEEMESPLLQARVITNMAETEVLAGNTEAAKLMAKKAHTLLANDTGTEWVRFVYGVEAQAALENGNIPSALDYIGKAFDGLDIETTSLSYEEMHEVAYQAYLLDGNYDQALSHHESFKRLSDDAKKAAASANLALLGAQFHAAEQSLNIERLKNEQMQKDLLLENTQRQLMIQIAVIAFGGIVLLFAFLSMIGLRKHRTRITKANEELNQSIDQLNDEINRRQIVERELIAAKDEAEKANRAKSTFLATMSHELRTPMNAVLGFSRILLGSDLNEEQRQQIGLIKQSGESLLEMINDILDLSQIEAGKLKLNIAPFNLRETVEGVANLLHAQAAEKELNLAVHIDPALPTLVKGDKDRVRQIILNLAGNAIKFTQTGSVAIVAVAGDDEDSVKISVVDTGIGVPEDKLGLLFDRFSQVDGEYNREHEGSGLGLAICKELIEAMDGEIGVESDFGVGSEFWITASLAAAADVPVIGGATRNTLSERKRVLVIDDNRVNRRVFNYMLPTMNTDYVEAESGEAGLKALLSMKQTGERVDAVIVSQHLAKMSATDLVERMRRNALCEDARLLLCGPEILSPEALLEGGFDAQIDQPVTADEVFANLRELLTAQQDNNSDDHQNDPKGGVVTFTPRICPGRVLVAEDCASNQQLIAAILKSSNIEFDLVRNGAEAVDAANQTAYDLILMDIHMPSVDGLEALRQIRRIDSESANTPVIALTALARPGDREEFLAAGMDDYIPKPIDHLELVSKVKAVLDNRRADRARQGRDTKQASSE
ncbi:MAG: response regulator [Pseudomonadota bacterium]